MTDENENEQNATRHVAGGAGSLVPADRIEKEQRLNPVAAGDGEPGGGPGDTGINFADTFNNEHGVVRPDAGQKTVFAEMINEEQDLVRPDAGKAISAEKIDDHEVAPAAKCTPPTKRHGETLVDLLLKGEPEVGLKWTKPCRKDLCAFGVGTPSSSSSNRRRSAGRSLAKNSSTTRGAAAPTAMWFIRMGPTLIFSTN